MDGDAFAQDGKTRRAATLQKGAVVGLDKLPADQRDGARRAVEKRGAWLLFLPPYAPDCNPIARALAKFKAHMKRLKPRPIDDLWQAAGWRRPKEAEPATAKTSQVAQTNRQSDKPESGLALQ